MVVSAVCNLGVVRSIISQSVCTWSVEEKGQMDRKQKNRWNPMPYQDFSIFHYFILQSLNSYHLVKKSLFLRPYCWIDHFLVNYFRYVLMADRALCCMVWD